MFATEKLVAQAGGALGVGLRGGLHPSLAIEARWVAPFDARAALVEAHGGAFALRVLPRIQLWGGPTGAVDLGVGGGVDVIHVESRSESIPSSRLQPGTTRTDPIATAALTGRVAIVPRLDLSLAFALDLDLASRRYIVDEGGSATVVLQPSRLRPALLVGVTFTALGAPRFTAPSRPAELPR